MMAYIYMLNLPPPYEDVLKVGKTTGSVQRRIKVHSQQLINVPGDYTLYFSIEVSYSVLATLEKEMHNYCALKYQLFNPRKSSETFIHSDPDTMKAEAKRYLLLLVERRQLELFPNSEVHGGGVSGVNAEKREKVLKWLLDNEGKLWTDRYIAKQCEVSREVVCRISEDLFNRGNYHRPTKRKYYCKGQFRYIETQNIGNGKGRA